MWRWRPIRQLPSLFVRTARTRTLPCPYSSFPYLSSPLPKPQHSAFFIPSKTPRSVATPSPSLSGASNASRRIAARCISSFSAPQPETVVDWNDVVSCSEVGDGGDDEAVEEGAKRSIPVRACFFSTSVDLRGLVEQNKQNFIPPTSRMTNYVVLKFGDLASPPGPGVFISGTDCCFMVVFQYGSIVLFNVRECDVDQYLKIVENHASGLLPEMRGW
ncbi:hypothetical protein V6N13_140957 [Hibiscus sabdariffa]